MLDDGEEGVNMDGPLVREGECLFISGTDATTGGSRGRAWLLLVERAIKALNKTEAWRPGRGRLSGG